MCSPRAWLSSWPARAIAARAQASGTVPPATPSARDAPVRLEVVRDTWVSEVGSEADGNNGGASRLKLKSIQEMSLIDVDPAPLRGRVITGGVRCT